MCYACHSYLCFTLMFPFRFNVPLSSTKELMDFIPLISKISNMIYCLNLCLNCEALELSYYDYIILEVWMSDTCIKLIDMGIWPPSTCTHTCIQHLYPNTCNLLGVHTVYASHLMVHIAIVGPIMTSFVPESLGWTFDLCIWLNHFCSSARPQAIS